MALASWSNSNSKFYTARQQIINHYNKIIETCSNQNIEEQELLTYDAFAKFLSQIQKYVDLDLEEFLGKFNKWNSQKTSITRNRMKKYSSTLELLKNVQKYSIWLKLME